MKSNNNILLHMPSSQKGLSLIELMISVAIGLLLLVALTTLFVTQHKTRSELDKQNRMIDNGRYALDLLSENLRLAGFYGELEPFTVYPTVAEISAIPAAAFNPCSTAAADIEKSLVWHVQGFNANSSTAVIALPPSCLPSTLKAGSDILVVRRAHTTRIPVTGVVGNTTYLQVSLCSPKTGGIETPYYVRKAPVTFNSNTFNLSEKGCITPYTGTPANVRRFLIQIYFIDSNYQASDGIPTLKMAELDTTGNFVITPLVEGIEYMQIDYGIDGKDTDSDGLPDSFDVVIPPDTDGVMDGSYISCGTCGVNQWAHVVSLKLNLISRNLEKTSGYTDATTYNLGTAGNVTPGGNYKRLAYSQVVRLINPSSRKE